MKRSYVINKALISDVQAIKLCVNEAYQHYIDRLGKPPGPMFDDYVKIVKYHQVYVIRRGKIVVGVLVLMRIYTTMLIDNIAVHPKFQGRGLGGLLLGFAEKQVLKIGFKNVDLYTHELMTENIEMYSRFGYVEIERKTVRGYDRVYMRKRL